LQQGARAGLQARAGTQGGQHHCQQHTQKGMATTAAGAQRASCHVPSTARQMARSSF
jgi:hypothetical protein